MGYIGYWLRKLWGRFACTFHYPRKCKGTKQCAEIFIHWSSNWREALSGSPLTFTCSNFFLLPLKKTPCSVGPSTLNILILRFNICLLVTWASFDCWRWKLPFFQCLFSTDSFNVRHWVKLWRLTVDPIYTLPNVVSLHFPLLGIGNLPSPNLWPGPPSVSLFPPLPSPEKKTRGKNTSWSQVIPAHCAVWCQWTSWVCFSSANQW